MKIVFSSSEVASAIKPVEGTKSKRHTFKDFFFLIIKFGSPQRAGLC